MKTMRSVFCNDGTTTLDDTTSPVKLFPYWAFRNVKLYLGGGLTNVEVSTTTRSVGNNFLSFFSGFWTAVWNEVLYHADGKV